MDSSTYRYMPIKGKKIYTMVKTFKKNRKVNQLNRTLKTRE